MVRAFLSCVTHLTLDPFNFFVQPISLRPLYFSNTTLGFNLFLFIFYFILFSYPQHPSRIPTASPRPSRHRHLPCPQPP